MSYSSFGFDSTRFGLNIEQYQQQQNTVIVLRAYTQIMKKEIFQSNKVKWSLKSRCSIILYYTNNYAEWNPFSSENTRENTRNGMEKHVGGGACMFDFATTTA